MLRRLWVISVLVALFLALGFLSINILNNEQRTSILKQENTSLSGFDYDQNIARQVGSLLSMDTQSQYVTLASYFKPLMAPTVYKEYFPTVNYEGGVKTVSVSEKSLVGTLGSSGGGRVFKLHLLLVNGQLQDSVYLLIMFQHGVITSIVSLG